MKIATLLIFFITLLSSNNAQAEILTMSCGFGSAEKVYRYENKLILKDKAFERSEGKWIPICANMKNLVSVEIGDSSAICRVFREEILARKPNLNEKKKHLEKITKNEIKRSIISLTKDCLNSSVYDDNWASCNGLQLIPTDRKFEYQMITIYDFISKTRTAKSDKPNFPDELVPIYSFWLKEYDEIKPVDFSTFSFECKTIK